MKDALTIILTLVIALAAAAGAYIFEKQLTVMKGQLDEMKRASMASQQAADAAREAVEATRKETISGQRPKLRVRGVVLYDLGQNRPTYLSYWIFNVGDSTAHVTEQNSSFRVTEGTVIKDFPSYKGNSIDHTETPIRAGEGTVFHVTRETSAYPDDGTAVREGKRFLFFFGYVVYRDDNGVQRRTSFMRRYDAETRRFEIVNDANLEYED